MMFKRKEKQSLLEARTKALEKAEKRVQELNILKNYYKNTTEEQREIIEALEKREQRIRELISNYEVKKSSPYTLIRDMKNELDNPLKSF
ncbi:MAG: hypothetical protein HFJ53_01180 [Clostridia bacterium]|jgi:hypothetical protein|nr:hypothetical protein [Clostridia bacterium]